MGGNCCSAASIVAFPQIPQLDELKTCRLNFAASNVRRIASERCRPRCSVGGSVAGRGDLENVRRAAHDSLGQRKTGRELAIVSRRAHHDRDAVAFDPDLERLFDRDFVGYSSAQIRPPR